MKTKCDVCMHECNLEDGQVGLCRARKNIAGKVRSINYGKLTSIALDPIEKKPLKRFFPGTNILSVGSFGCNLRCPFCQNFTIAMAEEEKIDTVYFSPENLANKAESLRQQGNIGVAFTYNEPLIGYEYILDTARFLKERNLKTVVVTNGEVKKHIAEKIVKVVDAFNIDLKGFTSEYYKKLGGDLDVVKEFITLAARDAYVELTTLIVPKENDSKEEMKALSTWVGTLSEEIPLHVSRFFPRYNMVDREATNIDKIYSLKEIASNNLKYVFTGNC